MKKFLTVIFLVVSLMVLPLLCSGAETERQSQKEDRALVRKNINNQKQTMGDLVTIGRAIAVYIKEKNHAPKAKSIAKLKEMLEPRYIKVMPVTDAWGHKLFYKVDKEDAQKFILASGGSDGKLEWNGETGYYIITSIQGFTNDIVFSNGMFVCGPKVK